MAIRFKNHYQILGSLYLLINGVYDHIFILLLLIHQRPYEIEKRVKTRPLYNNLVKSYDKKELFVKWKKVEITLISLCNQKLSPK